MARLRAVIVALDTEGDVYAGAAVKFYVAGTASAAGSTTSGTPFAAGSLYAAISGGSPISTTGTLNSSGTLMVFSDGKARFDVGIEPAAGGTAFTRTYESMELDPADVLTLFDTQLVMPTGTIAAPSLAQTGNLDTGFGVDSGGDPFVSKNGVGILETISTTTYLRSPDGTEAITLTDAGLGTVPRVLEAFGYYNVRDYGILTGYNSSTNAAANTTALQLLWTQVAATDGVVFFPTGYYPFNATLLDHGLNAAVGVSLLGTGPSSVLQFHNTSGVSLDIATTSASRLARTYVRDLRIEHPATPTGATVQIGSVSKFVFDRVDIVAQSSSLASLVPFKLTGTATAVVISNCKFETQYTGAVLPIGIDVANSSTSAGLTILNTEVSGYAANSFGIRFNNAGAIDTVWIGGSGTLIKDHIRGITKSTGAGAISNVTVVGIHIDGISGAGSACVYIDAPAGSTVGTWIFGDCWFGGTPSTYADYGFFVTENGGAVTGIQIDHSYFTNIDTCCIYIGTGVDDVSITNNRVNGSAITSGGDSAIVIAGTSADVRIEGNYVVVNSSAFATVSIAAGASPMHFGGGILRGKRAQIAGTLSSARVVDDHAYAA